MLLHRLIVPVFATTLGLLCSIPSSADDPEKTFRIFGHLTQAYGESSRGSIQGTTEGGTTDLRKIALQFRWNVSEEDIVIIQLSHERRGNDPFFPESEEIEIDWAFYERLLGVNTSLKVGMLNIPLGIYNEVRDVGTLLPFFNPPISIYAGVLSSAETVDGISISHTFAARSEWNLEVDLYAGGWDTAQQRASPGTEFGIETLEARADDGFGVQLWLDTPIHGLRLGAGTLMWSLSGPVSVPGKKDRWNSYHFSIDLTTERWIARAEMRTWRFDQDFGAFLGLPDSLPATAERRGFYAQLGFWVTPKIGIFGQFESASLGDSLDLLPDLDDFHEDLALSFNYRFRSDLLTKIEYHSSDTQFPLGIHPPLDEIGRQPIVSVDWFIAGLSVSF